MKLGPPIRDVAALALCPEDRAKGVRQLDAIIDETARCARPLRIVFAIPVIGLSIVLTLSVFALMMSWQEANSAPNNVAYASALLCVTGLFATSRTWACIQNGWGSRFVRLPGGEDVERLLRLLGDFTSQERDAWTGGGVVRPKLFGSALAIPLFSGRSDQRGWVRSPDGWRETRELYTSELTSPLSASGAEVEPNEEPEPALINTDPKIQWLVGGTAAEFKANLDWFLHEEIQSDQVEWYRLVFTIARREMRRGRQRGAQAAAIRRIKHELRQHFGRDTGPRRGDAQHSIKLLLQGKRGNTDITRYFHRPTG